MTWRIRPTIGSVTLLGSTLTDWELALEPTAIASLGPVALLTEAGLKRATYNGPDWLDQRSSSPPHRCNRHGGRWRGVLKSSTQEKHT